MQYIQAEIKEAGEDIFTAVASTEAEDRQGESVSVSGWQLRNFKDNPILLWMHDHSKPLGKATRVWVDKAANQLKFKGMISTATEWGKAAKQLMDEGILKTFSVGFRPLEIDGTNITKSELYEISLVSVPANPEARLLAAKSLQEAGFESDIVKQFVGEDNRIEELQKELASTKEQLAEVKMLAEDAVKGLQYLAPQRSKQEVVSKRLQLSKVIAKTSDKMLSSQKVDKTISAKIIKRSSEMLIRDLKGELHGKT